MPIRSMYVPLPPRRVQRTLDAIVGSSRDVHFELIPAAGGCVVALIWEDDRFRWMPQTLRETRLRNRVERLLTQLADISASNLGKALPDAAQA